MGWRDTATGLIDPGDLINYESNARWMPLFLRMKEGMKSGDLEVKRSSDGLTFDNTPGSDKITNCLNTTGINTNDDSDPMYARIAGSWANRGAMVFIGPKGKTYSDVDYWEVCFRRESDTPGSETIVTSHLQVLVSCNGGWNNISSALVMPSPRVTDDPLTRINTNSFGTDSLLVLTGGVSDGETAAPGASFTISVKGQDSVLFAFRLDWIQHDTLDRFSTDESKRDLYHPVVSVEGWGGNDICVAASMANISLIDKGACTRFGNGKTTTLLSSSWSLIGLTTTASSNIGKNTISGNEALNPFVYWRPGAAGSARGSGQKGIGTHLWFAGEVHVFGDTPYVTNPSDRPFWVCRNVVHRNNGRKIYY